MMNQYKTIRKNAKKMIEKIFNGIVEARLYTLDNGFSGETRNNFEAIKKSYIESSQEYQGATLSYCYSKKEFTIHYTPRCFIHFTSSFVPKN